ncbi:membrane protein [Legionella antarctica]|uniref:Membrane protein n=1 Tax=Legionella antarctica TaxID=2708020 RepID=A0A6F8T2N2_9GAMM|nr:CPBP family intramembrane metalloprotease [Legionella antarctica]BCA94272.1 membrane protein [Legionella antarctica]
MIINWPLIIVLFGVSLPGAFIAMKRLMYFLLSNNTDELKKRMSRFAILQTLFMVFVMSLAGTALSLRTGLHAPLLEALLLGKAGLGAFSHILLPTLLYSLLSLIVFLGLYYGVVASILDDHSFRVMANLRHALGIDGCVLYGVVEEVIARWGLMNLIAFFVLFFSQQHNQIMIWISIVFSGVVFGVGQIPAYLAAGCLTTRRLVYSLLLLYLWPSLVFGFLFWQYGILSAILAHMLFHLGWSFYDNRWK